MKKLLLIFALMTLSICAETSSYALQQKVKKINNGQRIFRNKLQRKCGFTASHWAYQHTKKEWEEFKASGTFKEEIVAMCKRNITTIFKDKWEEPLYLFAVEYAKDTGKRPRC